MNESDNKIIDLRGEPLEIQAVDLGLNYSRDEPVISTAVAFIKAYVSL